MIFRLACVCHLVIDAPKPDQFFDWRAKPEWCASIGTHEDGYASLLGDRSDIDVA